MLYYYDIKNLWSSYDIKKFQCKIDKTNMSMSLSSKVDNNLEVIQ